MICLLLVCAPPVFSASADDAAAQPPATPAPPAAGSDEVQRAQLRLAELGYRLSPINGISDAEHLKTLADFCTTNGLGDDADLSTVYSVLFGPRSKPAQFTDAAVQPGRGLDETPFLTGLALDWSDVGARLVPGETYPLTSCTSGIVFHMRYLEGGGHAELMPELFWDDATLFSLLSGDGGSQKMPVVISIGGLRIAGSIQLNVAGPAPEDGTHRYCLHFLGSASDFGGIVDAEHQYLIRYAAGAAAVSNMPAAEADDSMDPAVSGGASPNAAANADTGQAPSAGSSGGQPGESGDAMPQDDSD